jgi:hypothetical protein
VENDEEQAAKKLPQTLTGFFSKFDSIDPVQAAAVYRRILASLDATAKSLFCNLVVLARDRWTPLCLFHKRNCLFCFTPQSLTGFVFSLVVTVADGLDSHEHVHCLRVGPYKDLFFLL